MRINFLKSYKIEKGGKDYVEYSYVFTKGTQYMINICAAPQPTDGIIVSLYDSNRNKVATSKVNGQYNFFSASMSVNKDAIL